MTDDPYNPTTIGGWIRSFVLGRALQAGYTDHAAVDRDYERLIAAEDARDAQFWADMRADGVPVADPEPNPNLDRSPSGTRPRSPRHKQANGSPTTLPPGRRPSASPRPVRLPSWNGKPSRDHLE